ncbi:MAG: GCN5-related N-acetyltransferase, partial [Hyphomicrobiales bacterium]|nr:GCN5-related N-acetyltransferase [Hyphomicrobiales bacterium]
MALFRIGAPTEPLHAIRGDGVYLRPLEARDYTSWAALRECSRDFLSPWEPTWPADDLTKSAFRRRLRRHSEEMERDEAYPFLIFREQDGALLGGLTLGQVRRGVAQAATLGYWMGEPFAGRGYMARAARAAVSYAFANLRFHRIEAACLPQNTRSIRLLEGAGFRREGLARAYLR